MFCQLIDNTVKLVFSAYVIGGYLGFRSIHFLLADVFECGRSSEIGSYCILVITVFNCGGNDALC